MGVTDKWWMGGNTLKTCNRYFSGMELIDYIPLLGVETIANLVSKRII